MAFVKDSDGRWHTIIDQVKGSSCGPACVRMVVKLVKGTDVGEEQVRQLVELSEGGTSSVLASGTTTFTAGSHDWGNHGASGSGYGGSGTWNVGEALKALKIPTLSIPAGGAGASLSRTTKNKPAIAVVSWATGGLHWVVVAGKLKNGHVLVLDPACGLKEVDPTGPSPHYFDSNNTKGTFTGQMTLVS